MSTTRLSLLLNPHPQAFTIGIRKLKIDAAALKNALMAADLETITEERTDMLNIIQPDETEVP